MHEAIDAPIVTREMKDRIGVQPLQVRVIGDPVDNLQNNLIQSMSRHIVASGGTVHPSVNPSVNALFFPCQLGVEADGMFAYTNEFKRGVSGVAIGSTTEEPDPEFAREYGWIMQAQAFTQYAVLGIGDTVSGKIQGAYVFSMEGAHSRVDLTKGYPEDGFAEVVERVTHLAGGKKASHWDFDESMSSELYDLTTTPRDIIEAGKAYRRNGILPDISLENFPITPDRVRRIKIFLNVTGLTPGNISEWDTLLKRPQITGSGFDKGKLTRDMIVALQGFNANFDGTVVWKTKDSSRLKPSVESFDQLLGYAAGALAGGGVLTDPDIFKLLELAKQQEILRNAFDKNQQLAQSMTHAHLIATKYDPRQIRVVRVNPNLVPRGKFHSSCGTFPLAIYTIEAYIRSLFESGNPDLIYLIELPNHGFHAISSRRLPQLVEALDPASGVVEFADVPSR